MESIEVSTATVVSPQPRASMDMAQVENEIEARRALYRRRIDSMVTAIEEGVVYKKGPAPLRIWQKRYLRFPAGHYNFALMSLRLVYRKNVHQNKDKARFEYMNRLLFESMAAATVSAQNILVYYKTKDARELPQGLIYLAHITAVDVVSTKKNFAFRIRTLARDFNFATKNASEADSWVLAIKQRIQMNLPSVRNSPAYIQSYQQLVEGTGFAIKSEAQEEDDDEVFSGSEMDLGRISNEQSIVFDSFTNSQYGLPSKASFAPKEILPRAQRSSTFSPPLPEKRTSFRAFKNIFRKGSLTANTKFGPGIGGKAFRPGEGASKAFASIVIPEEKSHEIDSPLTISPDSTPGHHNNISQASNIVESLNEAPVFTSTFHANKGDLISKETTNVISTPAPATRFVSEPETIPEELQEEPQEELQKEVHEPEEKPSESPGKLILVEKEPEIEVENSTTFMSKNDGYRTFFLRLVPENSEYIDLDYINENEDGVVTLKSNEDEILNKSTPEVKTTEAELKEDLKDAVNEGSEHGSESRDNGLAEKASDSGEIIEPTVTQDITSTCSNKDVSTEEVPKESDHFPSRLLSLGSHIKSPKFSRQPDNIEESNEDLPIVEEYPKFTFGHSELDPGSEDIVNIESTVATVSPDNCLTVSEPGGINSHQPPNSPSDETEPLLLSPAPLPEPGLIENLEKEDIASYQHLEVDFGGELDVRLEDSQDTILDPKSHRMEHINLVEENFETSQENFESRIDASPETEKSVELIVDAITEAEETVEIKADASPETEETVELTLDASSKVAGVIKPASDTSAEIDGDAEEKRTASEELAVEELCSKWDQPEAKTSLIFETIDELDKVSLEPSPETGKLDSFQLPTPKRQSTLMTLFNTYTQSVSSQAVSGEIHPHYIELSKDAAHANFIYKQSYYLHNSNLRFAILSSSGILTYYRSATSITEGKSITLDASCTTEALSNTRFSITSPTATYYFEARSEEERNSWLHNIRYFAPA